MLKVPAQKLEAMDRLADDAFRKRLLGQICDSFPGETAALGPEKTGKMIADAIDRAVGYGLGSEVDQAGYVNLVFAEGERFEERQGMEWAKELLKDPETPGELKIDLLYDVLAESADDVEAVGGQGAEDFT